MPGLNSIFNIGQWALFASQSSIEVTGNNIANVNTEGYSRQSVRLEEGTYVDYVPGQIGTGVKAKEVIRHFDKFIEKQFNGKASLRERWNTLQTELGGVESILNQSGGKGVNEALAKFWEDWQSLSARPEDTNARMVLLEDAEALVSAITSTKKDLEEIQQQINHSIKQEVEEVNELIRKITDINSQINVSDEPGSNNANGLYDERARLVRDLAEKIDIDVIDNGAGNLTIQTKAGHTLVDGPDTKNVFELKFEGSTVIPDLVSSSSFDGGIYFSGTSDYEYTIEVVTAGDVSGSPPAEFKVSIDGGKTWLEDASGNSVFEAQEYGQRISLPVGDMNVWFGASTDAASSPDNPALSVGDTFTIVPKQGLYWYENTSSSMNITPLSHAGGSDDPSRLTGGSLTGLFNLRDHFIGNYKEKLDSFAGGLAWEVNRIHSQGAGVDRFSNVLGSTAVTSTTAALSEPAAGLPMGDHLQSGNMTVYVYNSSTGSLINTHTLDMDPVTAGIQNFDPDSHSLSDLQSAIGSLANVSASISNKRLQISADPGYEIAFGTDSTGILAGLGINTFFDGHNAGNLTVNSYVRSNADLVAAGHVNGAGEMNAGDNTTALSIAGLQSTDVSLYTSFEGTTTQTLSEYYNSLLANVGADVNMAEFHHQYNKSLADDLNARQEEIAGVNLDEEMSNLIRFQHSYNAAAKMIKTADTMFQTLLGIKQ